jgi:hypothetical protein
MAEADPLTRVSRFLNQWPLKPVGGLSIRWAKSLRDHEQPHHPDTGPQLPLQLSLVLGVTNPQGVTPDDLVGCDAVGAGLTALQGVIVGAVGALPTGWHEAEHAPQVGPQAAPQTGPQPSWHGGVRKYR